MKKNKILLIIQFRSDQSGWHELKCFYESLGVSYEQIKTINAYSSFVTTNDLIKEANKASAVILGGSGQSSNPDRKTKQKNKATRDKVIPFLNYLIKKQKPTLCICYGHQLLVQALGTRVEMLPEEAETGIYDMLLTNEGLQSPLFKGLNGSFSAVVAHKYSATGVPKDCLHLAFSLKHNVQAIQKGRNIFGLQFHPELNYEDMMQRISLYKNYKTNKNTNLKKKSVHAKLILENFTRLYL